MCFEKIKFYVAQCNILHWLGFLNLCLVPNLSLKACALFGKHTSLASLEICLLLREKTLIKHWFVAGHVSNTGFWFWDSEDWNQTNNSEKNSKMMSEVWQNLFLRKTVNWEILLLERWLLEIKGKHASSLQLREYKDAEIPLYMVK